MNNNNLRGTSFTAGFFLLIGLALVGIVFGGMIGAALLVSSGGKLSDLSSMTNDPSNAGALRLIQVISVVLGMIVPVIITAWIVSRKPFSLLGFTTKPQARQLLIVLAIVFLAIIIAGALGYLNKDALLSQKWKEEAEHLEKVYDEQVAVMLNLKSLGGYFFSLFLMAILPGIGEEMLFRGGLQNFLTRATSRPWLSIVIVSVLFSLVHFSYYGFLPRLFLGVVLGSIYYYTKNLWLSVFAHFLNNAFAVTAMYVYINRGKGLQEAMSGGDMESYWGLLAIPVLVYLVVLLQKTVRQDDGQNPAVPQNSF